MKNLIYIFTILTFLISNNLFAKDKLITIYDKDCGFCKNLLNDTYQNDLVKNGLNIYDHLLFEAETKKGIEYIKQYNITSYPTQIIIKNGKTTLLKGFLNSEQQLEFLNKPKEFKAKLNWEQNMLSNQQDDFIPKKHISYLCRAMDSANASRKNPFEEFMKMLQRLMDKLGLKADDLNKYAFENIDKLVCENEDTIKMRKFNTILKYAIDSKNYDFIRGAIIIKNENGKNVCNPYIDFNRVEIIDGQEETLIQFIDKLLNDERMSAVHDFGTIRDIKLEVEGCLIKQNKTK